MENIYLYFPGFENGWSITTLRSEAQKEFLKAAMAYVAQRSWTYFIDGNYSSAFHGNVNVTTFKNCPSGNCVNDPGNIFQVFLDISHI